jgi:hypothetical protein
MRMRQLVTFDELSNDADTEEHVQCVLWLAKLQFLTVVYRRFRRQYGRQPPTRESIRFWNNKLTTTGSLLCVKSPGKTWISEEIVNQITPRGIPAKSAQINPYCRFAVTNSTFNNARCDT